MTNMPQRQQNPSVYLSGIQNAAVYSLSNMTRGIFSWPQEFQAQMQPDEM